SIRSPWRWTDLQDPVNRAFITTLLGTNLYLQVCSSRELTSPSNAVTVTSGMTLSSSSGSLLRFTQQVQNPKFLAPAASQKFDEANATALSCTPRCCDTKPYTRGLVL